MLHHRIATLVCSLVLALICPEPAGALQVTGATYWPVGYRLTFLSWPAVTDATDYEAFVNGVAVPTQISTPASFAENRHIEATVGSLLGPADVVEVAAIDAAGTVGPRVRATYNSSGFVFIPGMTLHFSKWQTTLDRAAMTRIRAFAQMAEQHGFTRMIAVGHDAGVPGTNGAYWLGKFRARAAVAAVGEMVTMSTVVSSWGNAAPVTSNATAEGRLQNRRVELGLR